MIVKGVNLAKVRKALQYEHVRESVDESFLRYEVDPVNPDWPYAYLVLLPDSGTGKHDVLQAGLGEWHTHFDNHKNPDRNVGEALAFLAEVVSGKLCLVVGYDDQGGYVSGSLQPVATEGPVMVHGEFGRGRAVTFKSYTFNQAPAILEAAAHDQA